MYYTSLDVTAFSLQITQATLKDKKDHCLKSKSEFGTLPFLKGSYLSLARDKIQCSKATHSVRSFVICVHAHFTSPIWLSLFRHNHYFPDDEDVCDDGGSVNPCMLVLAGDEDLLTLGPCSPHPLPSDFTPKKVPDFQAQAPAVNHTGTIGFCLFCPHILPAPKKEGQ